MGGQPNAGSGHLQVCGETVCAHFDPYGRWVPFELQARHRCRHDGSDRGGQENNVQRGMTEKSLADPLSIVGAGDLPLPPTPYGCGPAGLAADANKRQRAETVSQLSHQSRLRLASSVRNNPLTRPTGSRIRLPPIRPLDGKRESLRGGHTAVILVID